MESELKKMQEKLLQGGINIKDRTTQQDKEIEIKRQKLAEERLKERTVSKCAYFGFGLFELSLIEENGLISKILKFKKGNPGEIAAARRIRRECQRKL